MDNRRIAATLEQVADLISRRRGRSFQARSYRRVARWIAEAPEDLADLAARGADLTVLPGVGERLAAQIRELASTGHLGLLEELAGAELPSIEAAIARSGDSKEHVLLSTALREEKLLKDHLLGIRGLERIETAGDCRRGRQTVRSLVLVAVTSRPAALVDRFREFPGLTAVSGEMRGVLPSGLAVEIHRVKGPDLGAALIQFTGTTEHTAALVERAEALDGGEVGDRLDDRADDARSAETPVYQRLGLPWIAPELREGRGEIEAAERGELPELLDPCDIRGDLQMHSRWSDGANTIEEMAAACAALGYEYMAVTDHSRSLAIAGGLDAGALRRQSVEIARVQSRHSDLRILRSAEVEIHADGSLDFDDEVLADLDLVVAAVHSRFDLPPDEQTRRILRALEHPAVDILAHPTGRRIDRRPPMRMDLDAVLRCAAEHDVAVELNTLPRRLDLEDIHLMRARELGAMVVVNSDAHSVDDLGHLAEGVAQARRGWLEAGDVLNTLPVDTLLRRLGIDPHPG